MGRQEWQVVNIDRRESHGWWGKLGECLFDGSARALNHTLRIPPTLPDCDDLVFPFKPGALCDAATPRRGAIYFPQTASQSSLLVNLPVEMIWEIYLQIDDLSDVVCLTMTCQRMWNIGRRKIYDSVVSLVGFSWAGDRIVCLGDQSEQGDIPDDERLLTPEEEKKFTGFDEYGQECSFYNYPFRGIPHLAWSRRAGGTFRMRDFVPRFLVPSRIISTPDDEFHIKSLHSLVDVIYNTPPPVHPAVLRNLSRHQYIPESTLIAWREKTELDNADEVGFGEIVLSRICFSTDPSVAMTYDGNIHRGVWAGDRFDIVASDWLGGDDAAAWTDISAEVLKEVEGIWRSEYESDGSSESSWSEDEGDNDENDTQVCSCM
ncbi:hypothetical protein C8R45DRAFT_1074128 [Mycena sanguinolenta]|nr:hypothetical protein C8R45DRAFT_1074128 [Mycena sanguinolenta]